jgi:hypothetical protein
MGDRAFLSQRENDGIDAKLDQPFIPHLWIPGIAPQMQ